MRRRQLLYFVTFLLGIAVIWPALNEAGQQRLVPPHIVQTLTADITRVEPPVAAAATGDSSAPPKAAPPAPGAAQPAPVAAPPVSREVPVPGLDLLAELEAVLLELTAAIGGQWGVVYAEIAPPAGPPGRIEINADALFYAASTTKLPLAVCLYEMAAKGEIDLHERLTYLPEHYWEGAGLLRYEEPGGTYSLRELTELALRHSDNVATLMLEERLGYARINECFAWLGGRATDIEVNETTPSDMAVYLEALLQLQRREPELGGELVDYLSRTVYRHRIPAGLPPGIAVANKTGTWPDVNSDVAIVYLPGHPYMLVAFVAGVPEQTADAAIAHVASTVHRMAGQRVAVLARYCREAAANGAGVDDANACPPFEQ